MSKSTDKRKIKIIVVVITIMLVIGIGVSIPFINMPRKVDEFNDKDSTGAKDTECFNNKETEGVVNKPESTKIEKESKETSTQDEEGTVKQTESSKDIKESNNSNENNSNKTDNENKKETIKENNSSTDNDNVEKIQDNKEPSNKETCLDNNNKNSQQSTKIDNTDNNTENQTQKKENDENEETNINTEDELEKIRLDTMGWIEKNIEKYRDEIEEEQEIIDFKAIVNKLDQDYFLYLYEDGLDQDEQVLAKEHMRENLNQSEYQRAKELFIKYYFILDYVEEDL